MKRNALFLCIFMVFACFVTGIAGDNADLTPDEAFGRIFAKDNTGVKTLFTEDLLQTITEAKLHEIIKFYKDAVGDFQKTETSSGSYKLHFNNGTVPARLTINAQNLISGIWFGAPEKTNDSFAEVIATFKKSTDRTSVCVLRYQLPAGAESLATLTADAAATIKPETVIEINADKPMAIGSTFKLFLLKALEDDVAAGKRSWTDIIELKEEWKSFPSGVLQDWNAGSRHTLETVAGLMISVSDNTATDHIFNILGVETVRKYFPESCKDVVNTGQVLKLKFFYPERAEQFIKADQAGKDAILREMDAIVPDSIASYSSIYNLNNPVLIDELEWLVSTRKLCETIWTLRDSTRIRINPATGMVSKKDWHIAGFKGGSEPGVLNYTWVLQKTPSSPAYTVSCTANNSMKPLDSEAFNLAVIRILDLLKKEK